MSGKAVLPMDSYRLAQYSVQVPCFICGGGNSFDSELCRQCQAPMALAHQAKLQKVAPQLVAAIGSADAGKTVYLGMLTDMLSRANDELQLLARGAFSVSLQQMTMSSLANCEFPGKTPNEPDRWNWIHCQVKSARKRLPIELVIPDLSGEAILEEIDHPHTYPVIREFLLKCAGVLVLIDAVRLREGDKNQDFFAMKIMSYLSELDSDPKTGWPSRPISLILTKADRAETAFDAPAQFAQKHAPGLWQHCQQRFANCNFFASGVAGSCAAQMELGGLKPIPLRVEPRGMIEPFAWLVQQIGK